MSQQNTITTLKTKVDTVIIQAKERQAVFSERAFAKTQAALSDRADRFFIGALQANEMIWDKAGSFSHWLKKEDRGYFSLIDESDLSI